MLLLLMMMMMMMLSGGTMLQNVPHGPLGESKLASAVIRLRSAMRQAAFDSGASDMPGLFFHRFRLQPNEPMGFWELSHVVRKTAQLTEEEVSESLLLEIFTLIRDTHDEPDSSSDEEDDIGLSIAMPTAAAATTYGAEEVESVERLQARVRGNQVRASFVRGGPEGAKSHRQAAAAAADKKAEDALLAKALSGHPGAGGGGGASGRGNATTITPHQLQVFLRTWMWRTLAFDLGWRLHEFGLIR